MNKKRDETRQYSINDKHPQKSIIISEKFNDYSFIDRRETVQQLAEFRVD